MGLRYAFDTQACEFSIWFVFKRYTDLIVGVPLGGRNHRGILIFLLQGSQVPSILPVLSSWLLSGQCGRKITHTVFIFMLGCVFVFITYDLLDLKIKIKKYTDSN